VSKTLAPQEANILTVDRLDYHKHTSAHVAPVELHSPEMGAQEFRAELADNAQKPPRNP
jgi:hypothetical protein